MLQAAARIADGEVPYRRLLVVLPARASPTCSRGCGSSSAPRCCRGGCCACSATRRWRCWCGALALRGGASPRVALAAWLAAALAMAYPTGPASVPADARAGPRRRCCCFERRPALAGALAGAGGVLADRVRRLPRAGDPAGVRAAPGRAATGPRGALRRCGGRGWPRALYAPVVARGRPGRLVGPAGPLPARGLLGLPVAAVPARLRRSAEHRARSAASSATRRGPAARSTCRWCSWSGSRGRWRRSALRFERERWRQLAAAVFAVGMAHYLITRPDVFHTAPLAVMVAVLGAWAVRAPAGGCRPARPAARRRRARRGVGRGCSLAYAIVEGADRRWLELRADHVALACRWPTACACCQGGPARRARAGGQRGARARAARRARSTWPPGAPTS